VTWKVALTIFTACAPTPRSEKSMAKKRAKLVKQLEDRVVEQLRCKKKVKP